jgi:hypothetical protein
MQSAQTGVDLALYASDPVARAWNEVVDRVLDDPTPLSPLESVPYVAKLLAAMREDVGRPGTTLRAEDIEAALGFREGRDMLTALAKFGSDEVGQHGENGGEKPTAGPKQP